MLLKSRQVSFILGCSSMCCPTLLAWLGSGSSAKLLARQFRVDSSTVGLSPQRVMQQVWPIRFKFQISGLIDLPVNYNKHIRTMKQEKDTRESMVHHVINRHGFYRLPMHQLTDILTLLQMPASKHPKDIQKNTIEGLLRLASPENRANPGQFEDRRFISIPASIKSYVSAILQDVVKQIGCPVQQGQMPSLGQQSDCFPGVRVQNFDGYNSEIMRLQMEDQLKFQQMQAYYLNACVNIPNESVVPPEVQISKLERQAINLSSDSPAHFKGTLSHPERQRLDENTVKREQVRLGTKLYQSCSIEVQTELTLTQEDLIVNVQSLQHPREQQLNVPSQKDESNHHNKAIEQHLQGDDHNDPIPHHQLMLIESQDSHLREIRTDFIHKDVLHVNEEEDADLRALLNHQQMPYFAVNQIHQENYEIYEEEDDQLLQSKRLMLIQLEREIELVKSNQICQQIQYAKQQQFTNAMLAQQEQIREKQLRQQRQEEVKIQLKQQQIAMKEVQREQNRIRQQEMLAQMQHREALSNCPCEGQINNLKQFVCLTCNRSYHFDCLKLADSEYTQCASCKLRLIDPLHKVQEVVGQFYFSNLEPGHEFLAKLNLSKCGNLKSGRYQIQLRCIKISSQTGPLQITWPDECIISLNDQKLTELYALHRTSVLKKRKDYPINASQKIQSIQQQNLDSVRLSVAIRDLQMQHAKRKKINNDHTFLLGVYYIYKLTANELFNSILQSIIPFSENYLNDLMSISDDKDIQGERETFSVFDPYSGKLMNTPVRGLKCRHGQCFDLKTYLTFMAGVANRNWRCPVCSRQAKTFLVDSIQMDLISRFMESQIIPSLVIVLKDGSIVLKMSAQSNEEQVNRKDLNKRAKKNIKIQEKAQKQQLYLGYYQNKNEKSINPHKRPLRSSVKIQNKDADSVNEEEDSDINQKDDGIRDHQPVKKGGRK